MKVQGCLMQVHFIEIHQVFAKKKHKFGCLSNRVVGPVHVHIYINTNLTRWLNGSILSHLRIPGLTHMKHLGNTNSQSLHKRPTDCLPKGDESLNLKWHSLKLLNKYIFVLSSILLPPQIAQIFRNAFITLLNSENINTPKVFVVPRPHLTLPILQIRNGNFTE